VPKSEAARQREAPADAYDPNAWAYFNERTPLGTISVPRRRYVVIAQTQSNARFYSNPTR
jgi:hypothetical protein